MKLEIIFRGNPITVGVLDGASVRFVMERVWGETGSLDTYPVTRWDFTKNGHQLDLTKTVSEAGLKNGDRLFLSLRAGVAA